MIKKFLMVVFTLLSITGCSTLYLGEVGRPYHGTKHAISAAYCFPYNSIYDKSTGERKKLDLDEFTNIFVFGLLGSIDFVSTIVLDTLVLPVKLLDSPQENEDKFHLGDEAVHPTITDCKNNETLRDVLGSV